LATAKPLGAPVIRVGAGDRGSAQLHEGDVRRVGDDTRRIAAASPAEGNRVAFDDHNHTLTVTPEPTLRLLRMVEQPDVFSYWQMARDRAAEEQRQAIRSLLPRLAHVHVFYSEDGRRLPLAQGEGVWTSFISELVRVGEERYLLLEFVVDDSVERMLEDAGVLKRLLRNPT